MKDALGRIIKEGDTVLTGSYKSPVFDHITKVLKVNKTSITVGFPDYTYDSTTKKFTETGQRLIKRQPYQMVVIDEQYAYNKKHYPENFI